MFARRLLEMVRSWSLVVLVIFVFVTMHTQAVGQRARGERPWMQSPTFGKETEVFVASDSQMILHGRFIEPIEQDGGSGYRIRKTLRAVFVNGFEYCSLDWPPKIVITLTAEEIERGREKLMLADKIADEIRQAIEVLEYDRRVRFQGVEYQYGESTDYFVEDVDHMVTLQFYHTSFFLDLKLGGGRYLYNVVPPPPYPPLDEAREQQGTLELMLREINRALTDNPESLVLKGGGYERVFPLSVSEKVKSSLSKIPELAQVKVEGGRATITQYHTLEIDGYTWHSAVIHDVLRNWEGPR